MYLAFPLLLVAPWISFEDLRRHRVPNTSLLLLWALIEIDLARYAISSERSAHLFAGISLISALVLHWLLRGRIGMGDIKLFTLIALHLHSLLLLTSGLTFSCIGAALWAITSRKSVIPFAPSLILGTLLAIHIH